MSFTSIDFTILNSRNTNRLEYWTGSSWFSLNKYGKVEAVLKHQLWRLKFPFLITLLSSFYDAQRIYTTETRPWAAERLCSIPLKHHDLGVIIGTMVWRRTHELETGDFLSSSSIPSSALVSLLGQGWKYDCLKPKIGLLFTTNVSV